MVSKMFQMYGFLLYFDIYIIPVLQKNIYSQQSDSYIDYVCNTTDNFEFKCNKTGMCLLSDFRCDGKRDCCDGADPVVFPGADNNTCDDTTDEDDCPGMLGFALPPPLETI